MHKGQKYGQQELASKVGHSVQAVRKVLILMVLDSSIRVSIDGKARLYELPEDEAPEVSVTPGTYVPEFKPLGIYDLMKFQRECESARNNEKGVV